MRNLRARLKQVEERLRGERPIEVVRLDSPDIGGGEIPGARERIAQAEAEGKLVIVVERFHCATDFGGERRITASWKGEPCESTETESED